MFSEFGIGKDPGENINEGNEVQRPETDVEWGEEEGEEDNRKTELIATRLEMYVHGMAGSDESDSGQEENGYADERGELRCSCKTNCLEQFNRQLVDSHILSLREMEESEKEMFIMGTLQRIGGNETRKGKRQRTRFRFVFNGKTVCRNTFAFVTDVGRKALRNLQEHVRLNGIVPRVHGDCGKKPHHAIKYDEVFFCVEWLMWYSDINGLPMPAAPRGKDDDAPVLLPSSLTKKDLHKEYLQACLEAGTRQLSLTSFKNIWTNVVPHIKIINPRDDVCHKCELLRKKVADPVTEMEKLDAATLLQQQDAQIERQLYQQTTIVEAQQEMDGHVRPEGPVPPLSTNFLKVHYTFDYSQSVTIPHHSRQMDPLYFVTCYLLTCLEYV